MAVLVTAIHVLPAQVRRGARAAGHDVERARRNKEIELNPLRWKNLQRLEMWISRRGQ